MRYVLSYEKGTRAFDSLAQLRYFLTTHIPINRRKDSEPVDPLCLEQAADGVLLDIYSSCEQWAQHYNVPDDAVFAAAVNLFMAGRDGLTLDIKCLVEFAQEIIGQEQLWEGMVSLARADIADKFPAFRPPF